MPRINVSTASTGWESLAGEVIMNTITDCIVRNGQCNVIRSPVARLLKICTHIWQIIRR